MNAELEETWRDLERTVLGIKAERDALRAEVSGLRALLADIVAGIDYERGAGDEVNHTALLMRTRAAIDTEAK